MTLPLHTRLYFRRPLYEAARVIGYEGIEPFAFWDAARIGGIIKDLAKQSGITEEKAKHELLMAVYDLTRPDRREASPPRYELWEDVKKHCRQLLGEPPGHPDYRADRQKDYLAELLAQEPPQEGKPKKPRKGRSR
jgi:hypothetical protein